MAYFGNTTASNQNYQYGNTIVALRAQMAAISGQIASNIQGYIGNGTGGSITTKAAIYDDSSPSNFIAETGEFSVNTGLSYFSGTFSSPPSLTASAYYYICFFIPNVTDSSCYAYCNTSGNQYRHLTAYSGGFPATITWSSGGNFDPYIICNYIATPSYNIILANLMI